MKIIKKAALPLSIALLSGCIFFKQVAANPKNVEVAIALFHKQIATQNPEMHWEDFSVIMGDLLTHTEYKDAAKVITGLKEEKNPKKVGMRLLANAKKMPAAIQNTIKNLLQNAVALEQRFMNSLTKQKYTPEERKKYINTLLNAE